MTKRMLSEVSEGKVFVFFLLTLIRHCQKATQKGKGFIWFACRSQSILERSQGRIYGGMLLAGLLFGSF